MKIMKNILLALALLPVSAIAGDGVEVVCNTAVCPLETEVCVATVSIIDVAENESQEGSIILSPLVCYEVYDDATGIKATEPQTTSFASDAIYYDLSGKRVYAPQKGVNVCVRSGVHGSTRLLIVE